jgi:hypothetical protein
MSNTINSICNFFLSYCYDNQGEKKKKDDINDTKPMVLAIPIMGQMNDQTCIVRIQNDDDWEFT